MSHLSDLLPIAATLLIVVVCSFLGSPSHAAGPKKIDYELSLSFIPEKSQLIGTAKISIEPGRKLTLSCAQLEITGTLLQYDNGRELELLATQNVVILPAAEKARTLYLSYSKTITKDFDNLINPSGISLSTNWYPIPKNPMRFRVTATLPKGFTAVMEADKFPLKQQNNTVTASFSTPVTSIHFNAGPYTMKKKQVRQNLFVYTMFFTEDQDLADDYLKAAADYLNRYEQEIGSFPYNHYVIAANRLPTGYSMPTFTLLGQMVLRLPFIKETSLGHEIVHSWFGNAVEVDYSQGNWCEGLTSFLADHTYREEKGEGVADRKETITRYLSYVDKNSAIPLADFTSASHNQPMAKARRAVGYNRGALLFYELREKIGRKKFNEGLRRFYKDNRGKQSNWDDLRHSFESASGTNLQTFFAQRLKRKDIPSLAVEDIRIKQAMNKPVLTFTLVQKSKEPYSLVVPIQIRTMSSTQTVEREITEPTTKISIPLDQLPLEFTIDPELGFLRTLTDQELPPVWSRFLGAREKMVILAKESDRQIYQPFLDILATKNLHITTGDKVSNQELSEHDLLFLGLDQTPARSLFGLVEHPQEGFTLSVRRNPLNRKHVAVLVSSSGQEETAAVIHKLNHYGKYSDLQFNDGRIVTKIIRPSASGLRFVLEELPSGGATSAISSFDRILEKLAKYQVIYLGETHTSLPDHLLQLRIIESLYKKDPHLAIGMEMFPTSSQAALDKYTMGEGKMDERTFLKKSEYYNVWRYDYRLFRDILNFAKNNRIPVLGLNLDRKIVSEVFRTGNTDSLDKELQDILPQDRDLDMEGYTERLSRVHGVHMQGNLGSGAESGFIQAQALWDETMAANISSFIAKRPNYRMIVIAGSQHTRKDSGIPPRVARRIQVKQASVLNIYNSSAPDNLNRVADYFFLASPAELPETPKIGIVLEPQSERAQSSLIIKQLSPHGKAAVGGLLEGDVLKGVNGFPVSDMADLHIALMDTRPGETIDIKVIRGKGGKRSEFVAKVELSLPPLTPPHP